MPGILIKWCLTLVLLFLLLSSDKLSREGFLILVKLITLTMEIISLIQNTLHQAPISYFSTHLFQGNEQLYWPYLCHRGSNRGALANPLIGGGNSPLTWTPLIGKKPEAANRSVLHSLHNTMRDPACFTKAPWNLHVHLPSHQEGLDIIHPDAVTDEGIDKPGCTDSLKQQVRYIKSFHWRWNIFAVPIFRLDTHSRSWQQMLLVVTREGFGRSTQQHTRDQDVSPHTVYSPGKDGRIWAKD